MQRVGETNSGAGRDTGQSPQFKEEGTEAPSPQDKSGLFKVKFTVVCNPVINSTTTSDTNNSTNSAINS